MVITSRLSGSRGGWCRFFRRGGLVFFPLGRRRGDGDRGASSGSFGGTTTAIFFRHRLSGSSVFKTHFQNSAYKGGVAAGIDSLFMAIRGGSLKLRSFLSNNAGVIVEILIWFRRNDFRGPGLHCQCRNECRDEKNGVFCAQYVSHT